MAYLATLDDTRKLAIANSGGQTQITLVTSTPGQQQSQSSSLSTGKWLGKPKLYNTGRNWILQIDTFEGMHCIEIQANGMTITSAPPNLSDYPTVEFNNIADSNRQGNFKSFPSMQPMQPMQMGNMSMDLNSMSMQMGDMSLNLNRSTEPTPTKQFCSQCGKEAKAGDRFCRSCGHELAK